MSGELRGDLFADLLREEARADLCLALGTSLAGMNADRLPATVRARHRRPSALCAFHRHYMIYVYIHHSSYIYIPMLHI
jgi:hypothetical protein